MDYNMKLRLKAEIEDDLAKVKHLKEMHKANADDPVTTYNTKRKPTRSQMHHGDMAMVYEWMEQTLNQYLIVLEKLDDDIKWTLFHLRNLQDLPNDTIKTTLQNIEDVVIEWNYLKEGK